MKRWFLLSAMESSPRSSIITAVGCINYKLFGNCWLATVVRFSSLLAIEIFIIFCRVGREQSRLLFLSMELIDEDTRVMIDWSATIGAFSSFSQILFTIEIYSIKNDKILSLIEWQLTWKRQCWSLLTRRTSNHTSAGLPDIMNDSTMTTDEDHTCWFQKIGEHLSSYSNQSGFCRTSIAEDLNSIVVCVCNIKMEWEICIDSCGKAKFVWCWSTVSCSK